MDVSVEGLNTTLSKSAGEKFTEMVGTVARRKTVVDGSVPPPNLAEMDADPCGFGALPA